MPAGRETADEDRIRELEERLRQREAEISLLREIGELIGSEYQLQKVFDLVAEQARRLLNAETVTIPVLDEDQASYTYRAAAGKNADELLGASLPIEIGICGWVFRHRKSWWRGTLASLEEQERNKWEHEAGSVILVPLIGKRQFLGGIAGINKLGGGDFERRDLDLLTLFASQVSIAIENALFFEELNTARQRAESYREMLEESNQRLATTNDELQHLAVHDPLTGLPNRTLIIDRLQQGILAARRDRHAMSLIMIDLDHFKEVNDTLGHPVGDELLRKVGRRFLSALREPDTLGRLGGDEFAVVLTQADTEAAIVVARKLQASLERPLEIEQNSFLIGCSIGIASYPRHESSPAGLLKAADVAMYTAKRSHEEYSVYDPGHDSHHPDRLEMLHDLRVAIQNGDIGLAFQPKLDLKHNLIVGVEALARWTHPERGVIPPFEFIPVLEHTGLIRPFTLQIIDKAAAYCRDSRDRGYRLDVAVNLSMHNLMDEKLPAQVREVLDRYRLDADCLTLEITESAIMHDPERSMEILTELHRMGLQLSVDDFGTGYSSLSYLKRLPVQQLKIDRSFVSNLLGDRDDEMIVRSTVDLAHNLGLETVAEGVETPETLERLRHMGCDLAQGFLISRPLSADDFLDYLLSGEWTVRSLEGDTLSA